MREAAIAAIALLVFAIVDLPIFAPLVLGWLIGWAVVAALGKRIERMPLKLMFLVFALIGLRAVWLRVPEIIEAEGLSGLFSVLGDRFRIQTVPNIAPPVVHADRRQRFFVFAPGQDAVSVRLGEAKAIDGVPWADGLFAVDYDPLRDGAPAELSDEDLVIRINRARRRVRAVVPRAHPRWICAAPDGREALVLSEETDQAYLIEGTAEPRIISTDDQPVDCAYPYIAHRTGTIISAYGERRELGSELTAIATDGEELAVGMRGPPGTPGTRTGVAVYAGPIERRFIPLSEAPDHLLYARGVLYAALRGAPAIARIEEREVRMLALGRPAVTLRKTADERTLIVPVTDTVRVGENHAIHDQLLLIDTDRFRIAGSIMKDGSPIGVTATSSRAITVALAGDGLIVAPTFTATLAGAYDVAALNDEIIATSPALGMIAVFDRSGKRLATFATRAGKELDESEKGELAFFESTRSRASCASCHLHADSDLAEHDIGHGGPSPTLSVRGVAGTSPFLRGASYPTLDSLDVFAETILGGYERALPDRARLLSSYVVSLPPIAPPVRAANPQAGMAAFVNAGCDRCHAFPAFTNLGQIPASFLFPERGKSDRLLDTPSLINVSRTAPYLDDGRAKTIESVLVEHNPSNRHGDVKALSDDERRALIALLETL